MQTRVKKVLLIIVSILVSMLLLWFGFKLLFTSESISTGQLFLIGCTATIGGVFVFSGRDPKTKLWGLALVGVGIYYFARTSGLVQDPWLLRVLGALSVIAAATLFYETLPKGSSHSLTSTEENRQAKTSKQL